MENELEVQPDFNNYLIVANENYIVYAKSLIYSISINDPNYNIFLYLINPGKENLSCMLEKQNQYRLNVKRKIKYLSLEKNKKIGKGLNAIMYSEEAAYSANVRGLLMADLIKNNNLSNLTYIDADSLINQPIQRICPSHLDLTFFLRGEDTCSSGLISMNINSSNRDLLVEMLDFFSFQISEYGCLTWFSDQSALRDVLYKYVKTGLLRWETLPVEMFDWKFHAHTSIWMGKGKKKDNDIYKELQAKYRDLF